MQFLDKLSECSINDCADQILARGWCNAHYQRWLKYKDPLGKPVCQSPISQICKECKEQKPIDNFPHISNAWSGYKEICKKCTSKSQNARWFQSAYNSDKNKFRDRAYLYKYGVTLEQYYEMRDKQNSFCLICGSYQDKLYVDHNHKCCPGSRSCGRCVRGLLCQLCNSGLGMLKEDISILENAITYLQEVQ